MTDYQLTAGGLYIPPSAADGAYVTHKSGTRFTEFVRVVNGTNTVVTLGTGTMQIDATVPGSVASVVGGTYMSVDSTDPLHPIVNAMVPLTTLNSSGLPEIVFDSDGHIVYTEAP